ncbi:uncharacterized protein LOC134529069 [Bacillus rossius redtenbacheri]|uniref:uncharacterized protein LOC134529069 n=1 Tax=Bacillus rossius redtenbacheri TaxID=93214 RepID=UPI002FDE937A
MWWLARHGLLWLFLHTATLVLSDDQWGEVCPPGCICHTTTYADLPMKRWLREGTTQIATQPAPPPSNINEVVYADEETENHDGLDEQLKMAMCIIQKDSDVQTMFASLPEDVQVLTILQSRGSGDIYLEATHMQWLQLIALDIQGLHQDTPNTTMPPTAATTNPGNEGKIIVRSDTLQSLTSLQYLNLQHVKILGNPNIGNRPAPVIQIAESNKFFSNNVPFTTWMKDEVVMPNNQHPNHIPTQLVILQPVVTNTNDEIVPYKVYKEEQERAGMSIFSTLSNLLFLRVHGCGLKEVNWEMFTGLSKLEYLSLEKNNLLFIPDFTFYGTTNLKTLSLAHNKLLSLHSTGLAGLLDLENLDLSYNNFSHLSELSLPPFPKLQKADFRGNPIQEVFASTFEIMNATKSLYLGSINSQFGIQTDSFLGLDSLLKLNLINVNIPVLERDLLRGMPELKHLIIQGSVKSVSFDAFLEMPKLENLDMRACGIESVSMDAFYGLYGLLYLDLSHNRITSLPPGVFDQQFSLRELYLENNLLKELPLNMFGNLPTKVVRLTGNPWECTCAMRDWKPSVVNGRKQRAGEFCQLQYDKGSMCLQLSQRYVYDRTVAPRCATPAKYNNMSVFTALRKQLHCGNEKHTRFHRKEYLKKKHEQYEKSLKSEYTQNIKNNSSSLATLLTLNKGKHDATHIHSTNTIENATLPRENKLTILTNSEPTAPAHDTAVLDTENQLIDPTTNEKAHKSHTLKNNANLMPFTSKSVPTNTRHNIEQNAQDLSLKPMNQQKAPIASHQNYDQNIQKAKLEKRQKLQEKYERTKKTEKLKSEPTYVVYNNKKPTKVSKKAWKMELAKTRQTKLKQAQLKKKT